MRSRPRTRRLAMIAALALATGTYSCFLQQKKATLPEGTMITASLETTLRSDAHRDGDEFTARVGRPVWQEGVVVIPEDSRVHGRLEDVQPSGGAGKAGITLRFDEIELPNGKRVEIDARPIVLVGTSSRHTDLGKVAAGGVIGAIVGGIAGGGKGAVFGGILGAGTGAAIGVSTRNNEIELAAGQRLAVEMQRPADVPLMAQK